MLENFLKSLGFLGVNSNNMNHTLDDKLMFKFKDENINKHWRAFYAFYKQGKKDVYDEIGVMAIQKVNELVGK